MRIILEWDGGNNNDDLTLFERALDDVDGDFDITDSIIWELNHGNGESRHHTEWGDIIIRQQI